MNKLFSKNMSKANTFVHIKKCLLNAYVVLVINSFEYLMETNAYTVCESNFPNTFYLMKWNITNFDYLETMCGHISLIW